MLFQLTKLSAQNKMYSNNYIKQIKKTVIVLMIIQKNKIMAYSNY